VGTVVAPTLTIDRFFWEVTMNKYHVTIRTAEVAVRDDGSLPETGRAAEVSAGLFATEAEVLAFVQRAAGLSQEEVAELREDLQASGRRAAMAR
jgi:hypothetical protein